ncbi:hypothetical protein Tco_0187811, partial [Tanacetum coccineum]
MERSNTRLQDTLRMESVRVDRLRRRMGYMEDKLREICRFRYYVRLRFRRLEAFVTRCLGFLPKSMAEAWTAYKANHATGLVVESQSQNGDDGDKGNDRGNGDRNGKGNVKGNRGGNGNGNSNRNDRGAMFVA